MADSRYVPFHFLVRFIAGLCRDKQAFNVLKDVRYILLALCL